MADRSEPQLTDEEAAELVERINGNPNLHPEASPPERTEELVERVALAMFLVAREEPGNEIYEESFEDMQLGDQNFARRLARAALQSSGYAEMERENARLRDFVEQIAGCCIPGFPEEAIRDAQELLDDSAALRGDREQGEG